MLMDCTGWRDDWRSGLRIGGVGVGEVGEVEGGGREEGGGTGRLTTKNGATTFGNG